MNVLKAVRRISITYVAYVCLLLAFAALGTFVFALATESQLAEPIGLSLLACLVAAVAGFRVGARKMAESNNSGIPIEGANIWAQPLRREEVDRYLLHYRGVQPNARQDTPVKSLTRDRPTAQAHGRAA